jgi:hypothetical protein
MTENRVPELLYSEGVIAIALKLFFMPGLGIVTTDFSAENDNSGRTSKKEKRILPDLVMLPRLYF